MLLQSLIFIVICNISSSFAISDPDYASMPKLFHLDDFDECMLLQEKALYCTFTYQLEPISKVNTSIVWLTIQSISSDPRNYRHDRLRHGICAPTTCTDIHNTDISKKSSIEETIQLCYNKKYEHLGLKGTILDLSCVNEMSSYDYDHYDIIVGTFFISYITVVLLSSTYEGIARYQRKDIYERTINITAGKIISAFSIPRNWHRLKSHNKNTDLERLKSIQGIRFYNLICVILSHTIMISFAGPIANTQYTEQMTEKSLNMFLANGNYAVQTFFLISGWLLSYHFFDMMKDKKTIRFKYLVLAFINRYIRLTPTLAAAVAFQSTWLVHMGRGPNWDKIVGQEYRNCRKHWWINLLYINNYFENNNMCMAQTWYIASDTQLYVFSLILLAIVWKYEKKAKIIFGSTVVIGLATLASIAFCKNYDIIIRQYPENLYNMNGIKLEIWHDLYSSGYSNITGYTIGLIFGYIFYKNRKKSIEITKIHVILWWLLSFGMCNFIILIAATMYRPNYQNSTLESALYWALGKNIFALGIAIGIYGFALKIGWFARWLCEWKAVRVIGRLTYSTYIVHSTVIRIRGGLIRSPLYVNDYLLISTVLGDIALSYLVGTLMCLLFEMPVSALQKLLIPTTEHNNRLTNSLKKPLNSKEVHLENENQNVGTNV